MELPRRESSIPEHDERHKLSLSPLLRSSSRTGVGFLHSPQSHSISMFLGFFQSPPCCDSNNSKRQYTRCFINITGRENSLFWVNVFDVNQALVIYKITQIALDHENPLEISFLAFYFLPHFFHGIEVDAGHFQASGGDNTLDLAETTLKLEVCFLQRHLGFDAQMTG